MPKLAFEAKGIVPYVFNRPHKGKPPKTKKEMEENAWKSIYCNGNGLFVPARQIKGCLLGGMSITKMKIERSNKRAMELTKAVVWPEPFEIGFDLSEEAIKLMEIPMTIDNGKMLWLLFPYIELGWKINFSLVYHEMLEPDFLKEAMIAGALLCGIGGRRPEFGRFELG